jgi:hypothetical protein
MIDTFPRPWNFQNADKALFSSDNFHRAVYYDLKEIAQGAPLGGQCFLETTNKKKVKIHDWCGGPPIWETDGQLIAIPIWIYKFLKGTVQHIGIVDIKMMELKIFAKTFNVLDLRSFDKRTINGYDSPIHKTTTLIFEIDKEKIKTIIKL